MSTLHHIAVIGQRVDDFCNIFIFQLLTSESRFDTSTWLGDAKGTNAVSSLKARTSHAKFNICIDIITSYRVESEIIKKIEKELDACSSIDVSHGWSRCNYLIKHDSLVLSERALKLPLKSWCSCAVAVWQRRRAASVEEWSSRAKIEYNGSFRSNVDFFQTLNLLWMFFSLLLSLNYRSERPTAELYHWIN